MSSPSVSVIVVAHDRRRFLRGAVESVLRQDLARDRFDLTVAANFKDEDVLRFLKDRDVRFVFSSALRKGGKIDEALAVAEGQIVALLDDDDLYEPTKLSAVVREFERDPSLVYYHHHQTIVDERNRPFPPGAFRARTRRRLERRGAVYLSDRAKRRRLGALAHMDPEFNDSSVAFRRGVVERCRAFLPRVNGATDTLFFYAALLVPGSLLFDSRTLSRYRVHAGNASLSGGESDERYLERLYRFARDAFPDYEAIAEMVRASGDRSARRQVEALLAVQRFFLRLRDPAIDRGEMLRRVVALLPFATTPLVRTNARAAIGGLAYLAAPRWVRRRYLRAVALPGAAPSLAPV